MSLIQSPVMTAKAVITRHSFEQVFLQN